MLALLALLLLLGRAAPACALHTFPQGGLPEHWHHDQTKHPPREDGRPNFPNAVLFGSRQLKVASASFPLARHGRHFVGSAAFMLHWVDMRIHFYDIAMYLSKSSRTWGAPHHAEDVEEFLGEVEYLIILQSRMVSRKALAALVDSLILFADLRQLKNYTWALDEYKRCYLRGPEVHPGEHLILKPNRSSLTMSYMIVDYNCSVSSDVLGTLVMDHYLGSKSDFPEFRDNVLAQLAIGPPNRITTPAIINARMQTPWWVIIVILLLSIVLCCSLVVVCRYYWRFRLQSEGGASEFG